MQVHTQVFEYSHTQVLRNDCAKDVNLEPQAAQILISGALIMISERNTENAIFKELK